MSHKSKSTNQTPSPNPAQQFNNSFSTNERIQNLESGMDEIKIMLKLILDKGQEDKSPFSFQQSPGNISPINQSNKDFTKIFAQTNRPDNISRRNTLFAMRDSDEEKPLVSANKSIVIQENVILEKEKLHLGKDGKLNEMEVLDIRMTYIMNKNNKLDNTKTFVHYLGKDVLECLLSNERILNTDYGKVLNMLNIFDTPDESIMAMIGRKVRPRSPIEYIKQMKSILKFEPAIKGYDSLKPEGYDVAVHTVLHNLTERFMDIDELYRNSASEAELRALPPISYGKDKDPGIFKIFVSVLGKFGPAFANAWDERKLNTFTNTQDFFKYIREKNNADAVLARTIHDREQYMKPQMKLDDISVISSKLTIENDTFIKNGQEATSAFKLNKPTFYQPKSVLTRLEGEYKSTGEERTQQVASPNFKVDNIDIEC